MAEILPQIAACLRRAGETIAVVDTPASAGPHLAEVERSRRRNQGQWPPTSIFASVFMRAASTCRQA